MQYLQMAQMVRQLVGLQGTGPSTVTAVGAEGMILAIVKDVWSDLQNERRDWKWMRDNKTFFTAIGTTTYSPSTIFGPVNRFRDWYKDSFYVKVNGKKAPLRYMQYDAFRYANINNITQTAPHTFTILPKDFSIVIPAPDAMYEIDCDYKKNNQSLSAATDIPELPVDFHRLIVYEAVARYALSIGLGHVFDEYTQKAVELWGQLTREQNPKRVYKLRGLA